MSMKNNIVYSIPAGRIQFQFLAYSDAEILAFFELQRKRLKRDAEFPKMPGLAGEFATALRSSEK